VDGNGRDPGMNELLAIGKAAGIGGKVCRQISAELQDKTHRLKLLYKDINS